MAVGFTHLHVHSQYSLLDGAIKVDALVARAKELGMTSVALTDHGNMFGAVRFYKAARKEGIKPIIGMEAYIAKGSRLSRERKRGEGAQLDHLILLAADMEGYRNLMSLASIGYLEGFYYKPRLDYEVLAQHSSGLIALSSCIRGPVARALLSGGREQAEVEAKKLEEIFGRDSFFLEIQDHGLEEEKRVLEALRELSRRTGLPLVATNDAHYLRKEDAQAHEVLLCLQTGTDLDNPNRFRFQTDQLYFKSGEEMAALFPDLPQALENTLAIAERCKVELEKQGSCLPVFPLPKGYQDDAHYLRELAWQGAQDRYGQVKGEVKERLEYELGVIESMGFPGYFLVVRDIVHFAKSKGIPVGPGRGSAAGSLVCYCLSITEIDPLRHDLLFERLLNPERVSMPDIDIDFCFERRDEIIRYVIERYSKDNVCQIITFGTMAARGVVRDVGRVLKIPYAEVDRIAKLIPSQPGTSLEEALATVPDLKNLTTRDERYRKLVELSLALEGLTRHASVHAAGIIITPTPLVNHVPLFRTNKGEITTQYDMKSVEYIGLLKIDILGLRTLTVIDKTLEMILRNHNINLRPEQIPLEDDKTYRMLQEGRTVGVFQLESAGMRELLKRLEPTSFPDIVAVNALYRPGPLGSDMIDDFVDRKRGRKKMSFEHPLLEPILKETYGVILYQEQVMRIASSLAGFTLGEADLLRKAMGKKDLKVMAEQRKRFIIGAKKKGLPRRLAERVFDRMEKFARYGFNKSHSAAYAVISARTAFLKAHYPAEFMAATLTSEMHNSDRVLTLLEECREMGIEVGHPDVNECQRGFEVRGSKILFGLGAVKNVGEAAIESIVAERDKNGPYRSLFDFCRRVGSRMVNRKVVESLVQAGALDCLPGHRAQKIRNLPAILSHTQRSSRSLAEGQMTLALEVPDPAESFPLESCEPWSQQETLRREKEALGFFLSGHPLDKYRLVLEILSTMTTSQLRVSGNGKHAVVGGLITSVKTTFDRKQNPMAFVTIEDGEGSAEAVVFAEVLAKFGKYVDQDRVIVMEGKVSCRNGGEGKLLVSSLHPIDDGSLPGAKEIHLFLDLEKAGEEKAAEIKALLSGGGGEAVLFFHLRREGRDECVIRSRSVKAKVDIATMSQLASVLGSENVKLVALKSGG